MKTNLPEPLGSYFAAVNKQDIDGMLAPFAADAVVKDEGRTHHGGRAVREWVEEVTKKYHPAFEVADVVDDGPAIVVTGLVSGTFPGSPVRLSYAFELAGAKITRLEIT